MRGNTPLLLAIVKNKMDMVQLIINYAQNNNVLLEINEIDNDGNYPLLLATIKNNIDIVKSIIDYANKKRHYFEY